MDFFLTHTHTHTKSTSSGWALGKRMQWENPTLGPVQKVQQIAFLWQDDKATLGNESNNSVNSNSSIMLWLHISWKDRSNLQYTCRGSQYVTPIYGFIHSHNVYRRSYEILFICLLVYLFVILCVFLIFFLSVCV